MNSEERLAVIEAREHIKELRASYAWCAARGDRGGVANKFEPDGIFELLIAGQRQQLRGRAAILEHLENSMWPAMVFPLIHNEIIEVRGDTATGTCAMEARTAGRMAEIFPNGFVGYYHDTARRQSDGRWLFAERRWFYYTPNFEDSGLPSSAMQS